MAGTARLVACKNLSARRRLGPTEEVLEMTTVRTLGRLFLTIVVFLVPLAALDAGVVPGRWEKLEAQPPGTAIRLTLRSGDERVAVFQDATPEALRVHAPGGVEMLIPKAAIAKVETRFKVEDTTGDGIAIGAAVGSILGATGSGAGDLNRSGAIALIGIMGAGVGYLIDKAREKPETLYVAR